MDRNDDCLVLQAAIRVDGVDTRFLVTAAFHVRPLVDTRGHHRADKNDHRLAWISSRRHHGSYLSMARRRATTRPNRPQFEWLLKQGAKRSVMVLSSWPIPTNNGGPAAYARPTVDPDTAEELDAKFGRDHGEPQ